MGSRAIAILKPSLFYLLYNHGLVSAERLTWAMYYQSLGSWNWSTSFLQILIAFDDTLPGQVMRLRQEFGELDEEPLMHLLLDQGRIEPEQFVQARSLQRAFPHVYPGRILIEQGLIDQDQLERILLAPHFAWADPELRPDLVYAALKQMQRRLWTRDYLSRQDAERLAIFTDVRLPAELAPLSDLLVINGDLTLCQQRLLLGDVPAEPGLEYMLRRQGLELPQEQPVTAQGLIESGLLSRERLSNLILHACASLLPPVRIQGIEEAGQSPFSSRI